MMVLDSVQYLDRRVSNTSPGVSASYAGGVTTWTLPYSVAVDGSEGTLTVVLTDYPQVLTSTRPSANQVAVAGADYSTSGVYIGVLYPMTYIPTPSYLRDSNGNPDLTATLLLHRLSILFSETTDIAVNVFRAGRAKQVMDKVFTRASDGTLQVPLHAKSKDVRVEITSLSPGARALTGLVWTGELQTRYRKV